MQSTSPVYPVLSSFLVLGGQGIQEALLATTGMSIKPLQMLGNIYSGL